MPLLKGDTPVRMQQLLLNCLVLTVRKSIHQEILQGEVTGQHNNPL